MATYTVDWFTTLDGFGSGPEAYWGKDGPELREQRAQTYGNQDQTLVFGANTYRLFQRFAPAEDDPSHSPLNEARKVVISRTLEEPLTWKNSTLIAADALDAIPRLKAESPVPLRCHGSIAMNRAVLRAGLVDRLELMVFPSSPELREPIRSSPICPTSTWSLSTHGSMTGACSSSSTSRPCAEPAPSLLGR